MKNKSIDYKVCDDSFGYLMYLLYKNNFFSELHLPSLNKVKLDGEKLVMTKRIPKIFHQRIKEIKQLTKISKKTNVAVVEEKEKQLEIYLTINSKFGKLLNVNDLSKSEKKKIVNLFFEYHNEINNPCLELHTNYHTFFNYQKLNKDLNDLKKKINLLKNTQFNKKVLSYLELISKQKINICFDNFKMCNVHGDFLLRNIIKIKGKYSLIDLDMVHKGYLEIQFVKLLKDLFGFATRDFFDNFKNNYWRLHLEKTNPEDIFKIYLFHKICDLSAIKSAYFTNKIKYRELQKHIESQINFITDLIERKKEFYKLFNSNLCKPQFS